MKKVLLLNLIAISSFNVMGACTYTGGASVEAMIEASKGHDMSGYAELRGKEALRRKGMGTFESCRAAAEALKDLHSYAVRRGHEMGYFIYRSEGSQIIIYGKEILGTASYNK